MLDAMILDMGGTYVKYGGMRAGRFCLRGQLPAPREGSGEEALAPLLDLLRAHPAPTVTICMPGPADYATGVSHMTHKLAPINGLPLKPWLESRLPGTRVAFLHDGVAFLLGEMTHGALQGVDCGAGVMLGTGLGFCLCRRGRALVRPTGTPAYPLWNAPWGDGVCEDAVSGTAMSRLWRESAQPPLEIKEIASLARSGQRQAAELFARTGRELGRMLTLHLRQWPVERVAVGGQIARAWDLMAEAYASACAIPALPAADPAQAALWGAYAYARQGEALLETVPE